MGKIQVRLKPHNPATKHTARALAFAQIGGVLFEEGKIVDTIDGRPITPKVADLLRTVHSKPDDLSSPLAFDVLEEAEMKRLVLSEKKRELGLSPEVINALRDELAEQAAAAGPPAAPAAAPARGARRPRQTA